MKKNENDRRMAALFLKEVHRRANNYADRLDPKRLRNYENDPLLRALDAMTHRAADALGVHNPEWGEDDWVGQKKTRR